MDAKQRNEEGATMDATKWELTPEEKDELNELIQSAMEAVSDDLTDEIIPDCFFKTKDPFLGMALLEITYEHTGPESSEFGELIEFAKANLDAFWESDLPRFIELMLKRGIGDHSPACATELGASYYMGGVVDQDYANAAELYEIASSWGSYQATVNLGYIYEYGRTGMRDLTKAFTWYALASTMAEDASEALYKMGDCYSRGMLPSGPNMDIAYRLWRKSYDVAVNAEERAQPAIRIAPLWLDIKSPIENVHFDPLSALKLYQVAEIGLRISIKNGLTYYKKRLQEAISGQARARELFDVAFLANRIRSEPKSTGEYGVVVRQQN